MDETIRISVHATPGARRNRVGGCHDGALRVVVSAPPDKGKANKAIIKLLASAFGLKSSQIELISGQTNRRKVFAINHPPAETASRLASLMDDAGP